MTLNELADKLQLVRIKTVNHTWELGWFVSKHYTEIIKMLHDAQRTITNHEETYVRLTETIAQLTTELETIAQLTTELDERVSRRQNQKLQTVRSEVKEQRQ